MVSSEVERSSLRSRMVNDIPIYMLEKRIFDCVSSERWAQCIGCSLYIHLKDTNEQKQEEFKYIYTQIFSPAWKRKGKPSIEYHQITQLPTRLNLRTISLFTSTNPLQNSNPTNDRAPLPNRPRILQLNTPPKYLLRLAHLSTLLISPRKRKPCLAIIPSTAQFRECIQQSVRSISCCETVQCFRCMVGIGGC